MEDIILLTFPPLKLETIWGDGTLAKRYNLKLADDCDINRCPLGGGFSDFCIISSGEYTGKSLKWLYDNHREMFGHDDEIRWDDVLPVTMAACWASEDLSVQVHPKEDWALEHLHAHGKSECWYFPESATENNTVVVGTRANSIEELDDYIRRNAWDELLVRYPVKPGTFYAIKAGTVHAIQKGSYFIEVCNPSPITYRFYDYDRLDHDGKPRELDIEKAKENLLLPGAPRQFDEIITEYGGVTERWMADNEDYSAWLYTVEGRGTVPVKKPYIGCFVIYGEGTVNGTAVKEGQSFFVPRDCRELVLDGHMQIMCCHG